jgi:hypothetical protein
MTAHESGQQRADIVRDRRAANGTLGTPQPDPWAAYHAARAATDAALARVEASNVRL